MYLFEKHKTEFYKECPRNSLKNNNTSDNNTSDNNTHENKDYKNKADEDKEDKHIADEYKDKDNCILQILTLKMESKQYFIMI